MPVQCSAFTVTVQAITPPLLHSGHAFLNETAFCVQKLSVCWQTLTRALRWKAKRHSQCVAISFYQQNPSSKAICYQLTCPIHTSLCVRRRQMAYRKYGMDASHPPLLVLGMMTTVMRRIKSLLHYKEAVNHEELSRD